MAARGLSSCRRRVRRSTVAGVGEIGLRDHDAVGEDHLLARLRRRCRVRLAVHRVDHGEHHLDVRTRRRARGRSRTSAGSAPDRRGPLVSISDAAETAALCRARGRPPAGAARSADRCGCCSRGSRCRAAVSSALSRSSASSMPTAPNSLTISAVPAPSGVSRNRRTSVVLPAPRNPVTMVTGIRAPRSRFCRRPNGPASREGNRSSMVTLALSPLAGRGSG